MGDCVVTITDLRLGQTITTTSGPEGSESQGIYNIDLSWFSEPWVPGDMLHVTATKGTYSGFTDAPATQNDDAFDQIDVVLYPGVAPTYTITLTVTDSFGRFDTISWEVTLSP